MASYSLDRGLLYIKPVFEFLGCAKISMHTYMTEAGMPACSMGIGGPGCLSCLVGRRLSMDMDMCVNTSWYDLFCLYPFIFLHVCWYVRLSCLLCSQEAPNHVPPGKAMVSETSPA